MQFRYLLSMKTIDYFPHTADIRMKLTADSVSELFEAALTGMNQLLNAGECERHGKPSITKIIQIKSPNLTTLLVEFMNEILALSYIYRALFCVLHVDRLLDGELVCFVTGVEVPGFDEDIKAVTYHEADVRKNADGKFETVIVFDI